MTAIDAVQTAPNPKFQQQGPDSNCQINGKHLGWSSCTAYSMAMLIDSITDGTRQPSGCSVRRMTDPLDTVGGLTLSQVAEVARDRYGLAVSVYVGSNVVPPEYLARQVRGGRPEVIQGGSGAMVGTPQQSTAGDVNHAVTLIAVRGGTLDRPQDALVYDPAADGRKRAYHVDQGPTWWPWSRVLAFCAALRPNGPGTARLGPGKVYCAVGPDTTPRVTLVGPGAHRADPFPDRARADEATTRIHRTRTKGAASTVRTIPKDRLVYLFQYARGEVYEGSPWWGGNDDGTEWIHLKNLRHVKGAT